MYLIIDIKKKGDLYLKQTAILKGQNTICFPRPSKHLKLCHVSTCE